MPEATWLLDSSVLIDLLRGHAPARDWVNGLPEDGRLISVVTAAELLAGCHNARDQRTVEQELARYEFAWLDDVVSQCALDLYRQHRLSHGMGFLDCLIAATAIRHGVRLATTNLRHFQPFEGLAAERPY